MAYDETEQLALEIIDLAKAEMLASAHFLSAAVGKLSVNFVPLLPRPFMTDGFALYVDACNLVYQFTQTHEAPVADLLHVVMHCVLVHPYIGHTVDAATWNLACDIASERSVCEMGIREGAKRKRMEDAFKKMEGDLGDRVTAERVYRALKEGSWASDLEDWKNLFCVDEHFAWYLDRFAELGGDGDGEGDDEGDQGRSAQGSSGSGQAGSQAGEQGEGSSAGGAGDEGDQGDGQGEGSSAGGEGDEGDQGDGSSGSGAGDEGDEGGQGDQGGQGSSSGGSSSQGQKGGQGTGAGSGSTTVSSPSESARFRRVAQPDPDKQQSSWQRVAKSLAVNLQTYAKARGQSLTGLVDDLEDAYHDKANYADFLRQFAVPGEVMRLSEDEFDYVYYTYGLKLYGNLPLIEPLEFRDEKRIRTFVIVIDTSGSVQGPIVQRFVGATFNILKTTESFHEKVNIHIIQCDAEVQSDDVITSLDELAEWNRTMQIYGQGGTDFRPAFMYIDQLVEDGQLQDLGGVIYFTDGFGTYPEWMPDYRTAFVFYDDTYRNDIVPTWAVQIVMDDSGLDESEWN